MHAGLLRDVLTLAVGVVTGVLSAAFGVGGAVVSTPGIRALGATAFIAVGTTLPSILLHPWWASIWSSHNLREDSNVLTAAWSKTRANAPLPAWLGGTHPRWPAMTGSLSRKFAGRVKQHTFHRSATAVAGVGAAAGLLSGLLGIGGGILMVPGFNQFVGLRLKQTIATSLVCVGLFAIPGTVTHALLGDIDWRFALLLCVGVIPGARIGAVLAIRADRLVLRRVVALFLLTIAVIYLIGEVNALAR